MTVSDPKSGNSEARERPPEADIERHRGARLTAQRQHYSANDQDRRYD